MSKAMVIETEINYMSIKELLKALNEVVAYCPEAADSHILFTLPYSADPAAYHTIYELGLKTGRIVTYDRAGNKESNDGVVCMVRLIDTTELGKLNPQ